MSNAQPLSATDGKQQVFSYILNEKIGLELYFSPPTQIPPQMVFICDLDYGVIYEELKIEISCPCVLLENI